MLLFKQQICLKGQYHAIFSNTLKNKKILGLILALKLWLTFLQTSIVMQRNYSYMISAAENQSRDRFIFENVGPTFSNFRVSIH